MYLQHTRTVLDENQPEEKQDHVISINKYLDKLEQLSVDLNKVAPSLPVIPLPKIGTTLVRIFRVIHDTRIFRVTFCQPQNTDLADYKSFSV